MTSDLHPQARDLLDLIQRVGAPPFSSLSVAQARLAYGKLLYALRPPPPEVAESRDLRVGDIPARYYRPIGTGATARLPLLLYFHGGGWTVGDLDCYDVFCRELANAAACAVLSVDYRLAPEHPFPAAVNDALAALRGVESAAGALHVDRGRIALGGDSAGGNLALVTALSARDAGGPPLRYQVLFYPSPDLTSTRASHRRFGAGYGLDRASIDFFHAQYLQRPADALDWRASPLLAPSLKGLPPALIVTAGCDPLIDDCIALCERLHASGAGVRHLNYPGLVHGFVTLGKQFDAAADAIAQAGAALRAAFCNR